MLLDSEDDVVRHRKFSGVCGKKRCAKGGRLIDRLHELMNNKKNWKLLESKQNTSIQVHSQVLLINIWSSSKILTKYDLMELSKGISFGEISNSRKVKLIYLGA